MKVVIRLILVGFFGVLRALCGDSVVVFNEVMYHPRDNDPVEWVELYNQMSVDVDVSGWRVEGIDYTLRTNSILGGGQFLVIASNPVELSRRTGRTNIIGPFGGRLANEGERLRLRNHNDRVMDSVDFKTEPPWPKAPDGSGFTLAKRHPNLASGIAESWRHSDEMGGTPGGPNFPARVQDSTILLNELAPAGAGFWVELFNAGIDAADLSNFELEFARASFRIPDKTVIPAGGYFVFSPENYTPVRRERVFLYNADRSRLVDAAEINSRLMGRSPEHRQRWLFPSAESPGGENSFAFESTVVINEIMYGRVPGQTNSSWIELYNRGAQQVDLGSWKIEPVDYVFPIDAVIGPGEFLVIAQDPAGLQAQFPGIRVLGGFEKALSRSSDRLVLEDRVGNPGDEVRYFDSEPWPLYSDENATSLELRDSHADNSKAESWASAMVPGQWQSYTYTGSAAADNGPTRWNEFIFGLLDAGEVLLDDFSVVENPNGTSREILRNGGFEDGISSWRFLGTHRKAEIISEPENPANHILHLVADGPTEHMHNHVETTLAGNQPIRNGSQYRISFRAKWIAGCNQLNTRLYFNRVARTTTLNRPQLIATPGARNSVAVTNIGPAFAGLEHTPTVPKPAETVTVSVAAADPDGVKHCRLWSAVNGPNWRSVEMSLSQGKYSAALPPQSSGTVVQFYIEAEDLLGAVSYYPANGAESRALYKVNDNQALSARVHNFRLLMLPQEAAALHTATNVMSNGRSLCTVIYDEKDVFYNCGLHLQASQRGRMDPNRVGFTVNFPADQLFRGVQNTITFDRSGGWSGRGGRQDEIVMRHIINQAGDSPDMYNDLVRVLTPLPAHTGTAMLLMAKYGNEFIDASTYPKEGSMFKLELVYFPLTSTGNDPQLPKIPQPDDVIGVDLRDLGPGHEPYRWFYLAENNEGADDYDGLVRMVQAFSLNGAAFQQKTSELLDMEEWTRVFAFKSLSGDADTFGFGYPHNQLFYLPPSGKALTFPWDMDFSWSRSASETINIGSRVGQLIHSFPANQRLFLGNIRDILDSAYNTNYMARWTAHYGTLAGQNYSGVLTYIGERATAARKQLPALAPFGITTFTGNKLVTNIGSILLRGTAPYSIKRLQMNDRTPGSGFNWTAPQTWETTIPLRNGSNIVSLVGYDFHNRPFLTNEVTIISTFGQPDRDRDDMPDDWELKVGLNPDVSDAGEDPDHDGLRNLAEYRAGTLPLDPDSTLHLAFERNNPLQFTLSFEAQTGKGYRLQYRVGVTGAWSDILKISASEQRVIRQPQTVSPVAPSLFYRVILDE